MPFMSDSTLNRRRAALCRLSRPNRVTHSKQRGARTLNPLIDELRKAGAFNEVKAKQLRSWADIRNAAAHGNFDAFGRVDVEQMIAGINNFLGDYLK
jgi:uncharacterized protein HemY